MLLNIDYNPIYDVAILAKESALLIDPVLQYYANPIKSSLPNLHMIGMSLDYFDKKKPTAKQMKAHLETIVLPKCKQLEIKLLYCTDGNYMRTLTKIQKTDLSIGYILPCKIEGYEDISVVYSANHQALFANADLIHKIDLANKTVIDYFNNNYIALGTGVLKDKTFIEHDISKVVSTLTDLLDKPALTCDIETFGLRHTSAGIGTIAFAWDKHSGVCINVERSVTTVDESRQVLELLRNFFISYKGKLIFHNATFDIKVLIYKLFMKHLLDTEGLIEGLKILTRNFEDTKIITYLATNTCCGNSLSLKDQAHEYVGNYAVEDIKNISLIPLGQLMEYNLIDCLATWYVYEKQYPVMVQDEQEETYVFFKKILVNILQMELTGLPIDMNRTKEVDKQLSEIIKGHSELLTDSPLMMAFVEYRKKQIAEERNKTAVKKKFTPEDIQYSFNPNSNKELQALLYEYLKFETVEFTDTKQPSTSGKALNNLKHQTDNENYLQIIDSILKILEGIKIRNTFVKQFLKADEGPDGWHYLFGSFNLGGTKSGRLSSSNPNLQNLPSGSTFGKLIKSCFAAPKGVVKLKFENIKCNEISEDTLETLIDIKHLATGDLIKACDRDKFDELYSKITDDVSDLFEIDPGWLFYGIDFNALEDRVNTLLTRDPNKMKIFTDGYDSHCYRAYAYFKDEMPDITQVADDTRCFIMHKGADNIYVNANNTITIKGNKLSFEEYADTYPDKPYQVTEISSNQYNVHKINSIKQKYPKLRNKSKAPSFLLQYGGTFAGLVKNCGFTKDEALQIEQKYHTLYVVSDAWIQTKLDKAAYDGYVTLAFGLRLRTPVLKKTVLNNDFTPTLALQEARTAGNALSGQSYCLLNSRAGVEFQERVFNSKYKLDIKPSAHIHDAQYGLVRNIPEVVEWLNREIVECVEWQDLPELQHKTIKLTGDLELFHPNWNTVIELPHNASVSEIRNLCVKSTIEKNIP